MGGGNGQKSKTRRERAMRRSNKNKGGVSMHSASEQAKHSHYTCKGCFQSFMITSNEAMLRQHVENKHSGKKGKTFEQCFPNFAASASAASAARSH
ncbi:MAG: hypothetical protein MHM6MM_008836 [Cercozoa sp. M6MM]